MKITKYIFMLALAASVSSCELLQPDSIVNPNVDEDTFLQTPNAMTTWVNGANRSFATIIGSYVELTEILSDNYFNNYSQSSKVFDFPTLLYTDVDVTNLQRYVGTLRETANQGLNVVAEADKSTTDAQRFNLYYIKGYSYLLAGEYFLALPVENGGEVKGWKDNLNLAISTFTESLKYTNTGGDKAFINTLIARVYYRLGDKTNAVKYANAALALSTDFVKQVVFDGENGVTSSIQGYIYGTNFQPLPRLDFLDPKYFQKTSSYEQRPICIAKAEEPYLILAEASLADNDLTAAKSTLKTLLSLVKGRPVETSINDQLEGRYNGGYKTYPNSSEYKVAASATDSFRSNLVLDRKSPKLISIPYISGTSVTEEMIASAASVDELLEVLYLMRQEIFMAEGRRAADLGIRLPVSETEAANTPSASAYTTAQIPSFIPLNQGMDAFDMDTNAKTVTIKYNMNKVIVSNKSSEYVVPFFN
nr:hypothetical protein [uncultured Bacteroides sp.]